MTRIIASIDNSAAAAPVLAAAEAVAHVLGGAVEALHVRENGQLTVRGEAGKASVPLRVIDGEGAIVRTIVDAVAEQDVAAVVLGMRRTVGGAQPAGHVTIDVVTAVDKPAVVVPPDAPLKDKLHVVLVPMTGEPQRAASVLGAIELVNASHIEVVVLHVYQESTIPWFSDQPQYETEAWAAEFLARYVPVPAEAVRLELRVGSPAEQIMRVAADVGADMIAMGWTQDLSPGRGRLVRAVLERSKIPVILLPVIGPADHER